MKIKDPLQKRVISLLRYDPETGDFTWRPRYDRPENGRWNGRWAEKKAGTLRDGRYKCWEISLDNKKYMASRLAWIYVHGDVLWADIQIDHIDGNPQNNKIVNLRMATHSQNRWNSCVNRNKKISKGVSRQSGNPHKFRSRICANKKIFFLGSYDSEAEASYWYKYAVAYYHGEFARLQ